MIRSNQEPEGTADELGIGGAAPAQPLGPGVDSLEAANLNAQHDALCRRWHGRWEGLELVEPPDDTLSQLEFATEHTRLHQLLSQSAP